MQAGQMATHRMNLVDAPETGAVGFHREEMMALNTTSEVVGNTAQGHSKMHNGPLNVKHHIVNESGAYSAKENHLSTTGGTVINNFNLKLHTQGSSNHDRNDSLNRGLNHGPSGDSSRGGPLRMNTTGPPREGQVFTDVIMEEVTASTQSQLLISPNSYHGSNPVHGGPDVTAWKQQRETSLHNIQGIVDGIREKHGVISQRLRPFGHRAPGRMLFETLESVFETTVEDGQLLSCIEKTFRKGQRSVEKPLSHYSSGPIQEPADVKDVQDRLKQILRILEKVERLLQDVNLVAGRLVSPKRLKQNMKKSSLYQPLRSTIHKPVPRNQQGRRGQALYSPLPGNVTSALKGKLKFLLKLNHILQDFTTQRLAPPSGERATNREIGTGLPEEFELAQVAATMLYDSLGNVCPNPDHHSHNVRFNLGTQESIEVVKDGPKTGTFELRVAFESSSTNSQTWFNVASVVTAQEREQFLQPTYNIPEAQPDQMDLDTDTEGAASDQPFKFSSPSHRERPRLSSSFSGLKSVDSVKHTAYFCLNNYQQHTEELAARLHHSEACEHWLRYPKEQDLPQSTSSDDHVPNLCALVQQRLSRRDRVRLARIIAESVLKLNATDWLQNDFNGENVLVYNINRRYEPHLRVRIIKPGQPESRNSGSENRTSQNLGKLSVILSDIALGANRRRRDYKNETLYRKVKEGLNIGYADVVRDCKEMADMQKSATRDNEGIMTEFYTKVVSALRNLEGSFQVPRRN
ncbi:hypothetical protein VM1G_03593 [Cytospora mali]|uniref:Uncharacterized protein n=1 Tax=Cytospora mali TaxID=578113 RepID=A0A194VV38_CYTMA|nr:hypothetical protein VM1G_03593 [Valsa mali]